MHGWKLDHENFIHEKLCSSRIWQNREILKFSSSKSLGYTVTKSVAAGGEQSEPICLTVVQHNILSVHDVSNYQKLYLYT